MGGFCPQERSLKSLNRIASALSSAYTKARYPRMNEKELTEADISDDELER